MTLTKAYDEVIDFIASGPDVQRVADFQPSAAARAKVWDLTDRDARGELSADERSELQQALQLEHVMRLAKARARRKISS